MHGGVLGFAAESLHWLSNSKAAELSGTWEGMPCYEGLRDVECWQPPQRPHLVLHTACKSGS